MCRQSRSVFSFAAILMLSVAAGCGQVPSSISVSPGNANLNSEGESLKLTAVVLDAKGEEILKPQILWKSSDPSIATVDATGKVTAKKTGVVDISIEAGAIKKAVPVRVTLYSAIQINNSTLALTPGATAKIEAQLLDENKQPVEGTIEWKSDDEAIATVNAEGVITAVAVGTTNIQGAAHDAKGSVTVVIAAPAPNALQVTEGEVQLEVGGTKKIDVQVLDAQNNALTGVALTYASSDPEKVAVAPDGTVQAVAAGEATVTVSEATGKNVQVKVTVR